MTVIKTQVVYSAVGWATENIFEGLIYCGIEKVVTRRCPEQIYLYILTKTSNEFWKMKNWQIIDESQLLKTAQNCGVQRNIRNLWVLTQGHCSSAPAVLKNRKLTACQKLLVSDRPITPLVTYEVQCTRFHKFIFKIIWLLSFTIKIN